MTAATRSLAGRFLGVLGAVLLVLGAATVAALPAHAAPDGGGPTTYQGTSDPSVTFTAPTEVVQGQDITLSGTGWTVTDGSRGSIVAVKLDDGGVSTTGDVHNPETGAVLPNKTIWAVAAADQAGNWSVTFPFPSAENSIATWSAGQTHSIRLLTGSMVPGDKVRTEAASFTVVAQDVSCGAGDVEVTHSADQQVAHACIGQAVSTGAGATIRLTGSGWLSLDGSSGAKVIVKLTSRVSPSGTDFQFVHTGGAGDAILAHPLNGNPDATIWAILQADAHGAFDVGIPVPQPANVPSNVGAAGALKAGQKLTVHFQTGLIPTDTQHSITSAPLVVDGSPYPGDSDAPVTSCSQTGTGYTARIGYPDGQSENPSTGPTFDWGDTIQLTGTGWCNADPAKGGSVIAIKLDDGAYVHRPGELVNANNQVWAIVNVDSTDGSFDVRITLPKSGASAGGTIPAFASGVHTLRLLTGSLKAGDPVRTLEVGPFTVGSYRPSGIPDPVNYAEDLTAAHRYGVTVKQSTTAVTVHVPGAGLDDWIFLTAYQESDGSPRYPWGATWFRADANGDVVASLAGVTLPPGRSRLAVQSDVANGKLLGWVAFGSRVTPPASTQSARPTVTTTPRASSTPARTTGTSPSPPAASTRSATPSTSTGATTPALPTTSAFIPTVPESVAPITPVPGTEPDGAAPDTTASSTSVARATTRSTPAPAAGPSPTTVPAPPFSDGEGLTAANAGGFTGVQDGSLVVITVPQQAARPGDWVFVYAYSNPVPGGWTQVDAQHHVRVDIGRLPSGPHKIAVLDRDGALAGWVAAAAGTVAPGDGPGPATTAAVAVRPPVSTAAVAVGPVALPSHGLSADDWLLIAAAALLAAAALVGGAVVHRRRSGAGPVSAAHS